jgi:hypothetical protein
MADANLNTSISALTAEILSNIPSGGEGGDDGGGSESSSSGPIQTWSS